MEESPESVDDVDELFFEQRLDHFDRQELQTFRQRYFVNKRRVHPNGCQADGVPLLPSPDDYSSGGPALLVLKMSLTSMFWLPGHSVMPFSRHLDRERACLWLAIQ